MYVLSFVLVVSRLSNEVYTFVLKENIIRLGKSFSLKNYFFQQALDKEENPLNKATAVILLVKLWLFDTGTDHIVNLGIRCDGKIFNFNYFNFQKY